jgi:hypothetical protein
MSKTARVASVALLATTLTTTAAADIRTFILLDISGSIGEVSVWDTCLHDPHLVCLVPLYQAQQEMITHSLATISDPACAESYLRVEHFSYRVRPSQWQPITTAEQRLQTNRSLSQQWVVPSGEGTKILDPFAYAQQKLLEEQGGLSTLILITDGQSDDGWSEAYGAATAEANGFAFYQITLAPFAAAGDMVAELYSLLEGIHTSPYGCFG